MSLLMKWFGILGLLDWTTRCKLELWASECGMVPVWQNMMKKTKRMWFLRDLRVILIACFTWVGSLRDSLLSQDHYQLAKEGSAREFT